MALGPEKLALASRPRGGDWLKDEMAEWRRAGVDTVLSLLTPEEELDLDLKSEAREVAARGMKFASLPVPDRQVPNSEAEVSAALDQLDADLAAGKNVAVHCRQGIGRTGLVAACLLVTKGMNPEAAVRRLSGARGIPVPETAEQRRLRRSVGRHQMTVVRRWSFAIRGWPARALLQATCE